MCVCVCRALQVAAVSVQERQKCVSAFVDFGSKKEYIQFLEQELEQARLVFEGVGGGHRKGHLERSILVQILAP